MNRAALAILAVFVAACGHKIGDSCSVSSDCAQDGTRVCDTYSPNGGYCTVQGCDYGTCPDEAVCVRFFPALDVGAPCTSQDDCVSDEVCSEVSRRCVPRAVACSNQSDCSPDDVCTVGGRCAPRSIEQRFCMLSCSSDGDCRDGYECRAKELMQLHGGEPVPDPHGDSAVVPDQPFCAGKRSCTTDFDCPMGEGCQRDSHVCTAK